MPRKNLEIKKKRYHLPNHGAVPGGGPNNIDPRPGADKRTKRAASKQAMPKTLKEELARYEAKFLQSPVGPIEYFSTIKKIKDKWAKKTKDEATVKAQMAKDEAEEKARQKKNAEEAKKKPKKKQGRKGLSIKRRGK
tara:strand:- start:395 stop:805 length:411 start_codon:yes stop_codon:yes gene_type:complete